MTLPYGMYACELRHVDFEAAEGAIVWPGSFSTGTGMASPNIEALGLGNAFGIALCMLLMDD